MLNSNHRMALEAIPAEASARSRYFIPVCLYPHTKYRTRRGLLDLVSKFRLAECDHLIVVADKLLALDRIVTGRFWNENGVFEKARRESQDVFRLIKKVSNSERSVERCRLAYWDDIAATESFRKFQSRLLASCRDNVSFMAVLDGFVGERVARFGMGADVDRERQAEFDYILGELTMSVYATEILGYWTEIWEKPLEAGAIDPLRVLYEDFPSLVNAACQRSFTVRRLDFLYDVANAA